MQASHADRVLIRVSTTVGEEDFLKTLRCVREDFLCCQRANIVRVCWRHSGEHIRLCFDGGNHLGVLMANVDVHQHGGEVEVGVALVIPHPGTLPSSNHEGSKSSLRRPRVEDVTSVCLANGRIIGRVHQW